MLSVLLSMGMSPLSTQTQFVHLGVEMGFWMGLPDFLFFIGYTLLVIVGGIWYHLVTGMDGNTNNMRTMGCVMLCLSFYLVWLPFSCKLTHSLKVVMSAGGKTKLRNLLESKQDLSDIINGAGLDVDLLESLDDQSLMNSILLDAGVGNVIHRLELIGCMRG